MTEESKIKRGFPRSVSGPAPGQDEKRALFQRNGGTFEITGGFFLEICSTNNVNSCFFHGQETLFEERSLPMSLLPRPEANKSGSHKLQIVNHVFYQNKVDILVGQGARTP